LTESDFTLHVGQLVMVVQAGL